MLVPKFEISQDDKFVILSIHAPYTKITDVEYWIEGTSFSFFAKPYILRLNLPGEVQEDGSKSKYEVESGNYIIHAKKVNPDQHFNDLDLLTTLLTTKEDVGQIKSTPLIEVLESNNDETSILEDECAKNSDATIDQGYGFANQKSNIYDKLNDSGLAIFYATNLDSSSVKERNIERLESEQDDFDSDHYLADLYEDEEIQPVLSYSPWWCKNGYHKVVFTQQENDVLQTLPRKEYLISNQEQQVILLGLVDILYSYAYCLRSTEGEGCVEDSWTIRTISPTLSYCIIHHTVSSCLTACVRRSLIYPRFRHWKLSEKVLKDVKRIIRGGRRCILRCFLDVYRIFQETDISPCYILNDFYIKDYCVWLQSRAFTEEDAKKLLEDIVATDLTKGDVDLELVELERAAELVLLEEDQDTSSDCSETSSDETASSEEVSTSEDRDSLPQSTSFGENLLESVTEQLQGFEIKEVSSRAL